MPPVNTPRADGHGDRPSLGRSTRLPDLPSLDGLRALAVIAVLLYHAGLSWIPGGFIGVEVFFVISGYLITSLLLAEWRGRGRIDLKSFWLRRAKRLLPALYLVLAVTLAYAVIVLPAEVAGLRHDAIAAFGYVTNWYLVLVNESYFETIGRPSLLKHLWSLAIEEQFYLVWPLLFAAGMACWGSIQLRHRVFFFVLAGAAVSGLLMAVLYQPEVDPSRIYYGTDTRASGLLIGVALAFVWWPERFRALGLRAANRTSRTVPLLLDALGLAALAGLIFFCLWLSEFRPFLYRGGFALVALASALLIAVVVHPRARLCPGLLGLKPLRWVGLRSYGIYLWHWPVFMITRPQLDVPLEGLELLALRLSATVVLAELSYRLVETPIRRGALRQAWRALREARGARRWGLGAGWAAGVGTGVASCVVLGVAVAQAQAPEPPSYLSKMKVHAERPVAASKPANTTEKNDPADTGAASAAVPGEGFAAGKKDTAPAVVGASEPKARAEASETAPASAAQASTGAVTAIGDSVMIGVVEELQKEIPNLALVDAQGSRQAPAAISILRQWREKGKLGDAVVIHIGNNGVLTDEQFDEMMGMLTGVREVLIVNTTVPDGYQWVPNNAVLADGVGRYPEKAVLVDWHAESTEHPEYFWDGLHLTPQGQRAYTYLIAAHLEGWPVEAKR